MEPPALDALAARVARAGARLADAERELGALAAASEAGSRLGARADALAAATDAHARDARDLARRVRAAPRGDDHVALRARIAAAVEAELASPELSRGEGSRFGAAVAGADRALLRDPHRRLRRCGIRLYEAWGQLAWGLVQLYARLVYTRPHAELEGARGDER